MIATQRQRVFTEFKVGAYRCAFGQQTDTFDNPTNEWSVWKWNGYFWEILIALVEPPGDMEAATYAAQWHLTKP